MKIAFVPTVIERYERLEICFDRNWINFLNFCFKKVKIKILYNINQNIKNYNLIIFSGGNDIVSHKKNLANIFRNKIDSYYFNKALINNIPILGICHGSHFIAQKYKFKLVKKKHIGNHKVKILNSNNSRDFNVNSYHNYVIKNLNNKVFETIAVAGDNTIECYTHRYKKILGIIWHPERYEKFRLLDKNLLNNFIKKNV